MILRWSSRNTTTRVVPSFGRLSPEFDEFDFLRLLYKRFEAHEYPQVSHSNSFFPILYYSPFYSIAEELDDYNCNPTRNYNGSNDDITPNT